MPALEEGFAQDLIPASVALDEAAAETTDVRPATAPADAVGSDADELSDRFRNASAAEILRASIRDIFPGRIALVSSFGADSVVLLHLVSQIDRTIPVVFVDTGMLFPETIAYRDRLASHLGLTNISTHGPDRADLDERDPENFLWASDPDGCCRIRKVLPLARALEGYDAWISGRKRFQASTRGSLPAFEAEGRRMKVNALCDWSAADILAHIANHDLPRHDLVARNYPSIGCIPCTSPVRPGEDPRAGRWRGKAKVECGIHTEFLHAGDGI